MEPIKIEREHEIPMLSKYDVRFFVKFSGDGYNLGIIVPDWWWDKVKASCPKPTKQDRDYLTGRIELILTTISYREFELH